MASGKPFSTHIAPVAESREHMATSVLEKLLITNNGNNGHNPFNVDA